MRRRDTRHVGPLAILRATPRAVLVPHDGSWRAERALARAVELCRETHACLGLMVIHRVVVLNMPLVCVAASISEHDACNRLLRQLPDDISVKFLSCPHPAGMVQIAEFAKRLACDSVVLPYSGWRARRAARILARHGVAVLLDPDGLQSPRTRRRASRRASQPDDPLALDPATGARTYPVARLAEQPGNRLFSARPPG